MRYFLSKSFILIIIIAISTICLKYLLPFEKNYNSAMVDKLELLQKNKAKQKILLIGGSSVGWGLSAEQIQNATSITTINLGHHAGFGLLDYQDFVISCLTPNDIVIFSPEWDFYNNPDFFDTATLNDLHKNMTYLTITNKSLFTKVKSLFLRNISFSSNKVQDQNNPYIYNCLNKNGDVVSHCGINPKGPKQYQIAFSHFDMKLWISKFKYISKANCILLMPPTQKSIYEKNKLSFDSLQLIFNKCNLNYVDRIIDNTYEEIDFFDAEYHLKCEIRTERTAKIIEYIKVFNTANQNAKAGLR
jgi:hypothetical protein